MKTGEKAWICLFTCAVFRAIHMELTFSLSTSGFLQVLRRFVARRGRPRVLYSDNGTNFRGADNAFANLDWELITRETATERIVWRFNAPSAPWWGGFFERMIGIVKKLLRRVLGNAKLYYEELLTVICDCESVVNNRPLTYLSSDPDDLVVLTPVMFLRDLTSSEMPDCDLIDKVSLTSSLRYKQRLREDLRRRFRIEYLGQLKLKCEKRSDKSVKIGDVVLIENDCMKRVQWPIGRVIGLIQGKDDRVRLVRLKTAKGELLRPIQRLFPLECSGESEFGENLVEESNTRGDSSQDDHQVFPKEDPKSAGVFNKSRVPVKVMRCGRISRLPKRYL